MADQQLLTNGDSQAGAEEKEMSFLDHLEELRWHILRSLAAIVTFGVIAFLNKRFIFHDLILGPSRNDFFTYRFFCWVGRKWDLAEICIDNLNFTLQSRQMTGQFTAHITVSFVAGLIVAFPYVFWEFWQFIKPGLYPRERKATRWAVFAVSFLFLSGILFGYYVLSPLSINFLANYTVDETVRNDFDLLSYMGTLVTMVMACGLTFQLPVIIFVLAKVGIIGAQMMRTFRRHAFIVILIVAAILTPSPDAFSQMLVAIPLYTLYELSIFVAAYVERENRKALEAKNLV